MAAPPITEWLAARAEGVPEALAERIAALVVESGADRVDDAPTALARAATFALAGAAERGGERRGALDVLAADALVTYACESLADARDLDAAATALAVRLAAVRPDAARNAVTGDSAPTS